MLERDYLIGAVILTVAALLAGCGSSAIGLHARAALITTSVHSAAGREVDSARGDALERIEEETRGQPVGARLEALRAERQRWAPIGAGLDGARDAIIAWVQALELARVAGAGDDLLAPLGALAARVALLYDDVQRLAAGVGLELPALPDAIRGLASGIGGGR